MPAVAIVPAAGKGERFGGAKLLADVGGRPLLDRTLQALLDGGIAQVVVVTPPASTFAAVPLMQDARVTRVENPDPSRGMFSSIQAGVAAAAGDPVVILPADMPFVRGVTVAGVVAECERTQRVVLPTHAGRHGHPVALPAALRAAILAAGPGLSLNDILRGAGERRDWPVDDPGVLRDVDVAGDLIGY